MMKGDGDNFAGVVLITGGTGLIGKAVQNVIKSSDGSDPDYQKYKFVPIGSADGDLTNYDDARRIFDQHRPTHVLHLAAMVGGLFKNQSNNLQFFRSNMAINDNILRLCDEYKVIKCVSCLSTCIFPDKTTYPIDETMVHLGPPHNSNFGYSYAKRMIDVLNRGYSQKNDQASGESHKPIFTSVIPTNVYGPHDNYHLKDSHVIPGLIHKAYIQVQEALKKNSSEAYLTVYGSGKPLRQFIYSEDLARLMLWTLFKYEEIDPIILSVDESEEITINQAAQLVADACMKLEPRVKLQLKNDTTFGDGQLKKTACNHKLRKYLPDFKFTPIHDGIFESVKWFWKNYEAARK